MTQLFEKIVSTLDQSLSSGVFQLTKLNLANGKLLIDELCQSSTAKQADSNGLSTFEVGG